MVNYKRKCHDGQPFYRIFGKLAKDSKETKLEIISMVILLIFPFLEKMT